MSINSQLRGALEREEEAHRASLGCVAPALRRVYLEESMDTPIIPAVPTIRAHAAASMFAHRTTLIWGCPHRAGRLRARRE